MNIYFDTEFIDTGKTLELISIGAVDEKGNTYYAESAEADVTKACEWVQKNVVPHLTGRKKPHTEIALELVEFCGPNPKFWTYYGSYDWVLLSRLFGRMLDVPAHWPMFPMDIMNILTYHRLSQGVLPKQTTAAHNALGDAVWTMHAHDHLMRMLSLGK